MCIWPQHVCSSGKTTSCPSRSSTATVARPTSGVTASPMQVTNNAMRTLYCYRVRVGESYSTATSLRGCAGSRSKIQKSRPITCTVTL